MLLHQPYARRSAEPRLPHPDDPGISSRALAGEGSVTIPTAGFPAGTHKLAYLGHEEAASEITSTVTAVIPFRVG